MLNSESIVARRSDVLFSSGPDFVAIARGAPGDDFRFEGTARDIWWMLEHPIAVSELCRRLAESHGVCASQVEPDVLEFLHDLEREKLIRVERDGERSLRPNPVTSGRGRRHLFLALQGASWGECLMTLRIADRLHAAGHECAFLADRDAAELFRGSPHRVEWTRGLGVRLAARIEELVDELRPASIVLGDYATSLYHFEARSVDPVGVLEYGVPVVALDPWEMGGENTSFDKYLGRSTACSILEGLLERRLFPVPHLAPRGRKGECVLMPEAAVLSEAERKRVRSELAVHEDQRLILFCTARWQHHERMDPNGLRLKASVPRLLLSHFQRLGPDTVFVHVGPEPLPGVEALGDRFRFPGLLPRAEFLRVMASADLVLSLNQAATSNGLAIASGIPVLAGINSCAAETFEEAVAWAGGSAPSAALDWLARSLPLYRFRGWPLGLYETYGRVLRDNPYLRTFETAEIARGDEFVEAATRLLRDSSSVDAMRERQAAYVSAVSRLPGPVEALESLL